MPARGCVIVPLGSMLLPVPGRRLLPASAHNGAIVVLHITQANAPRTADALPAIITGLRARGYQLVTVSELLAPRPQ